MQEPSSCRKVWLIRTGYFWVIIWHGGESILQPSDYHPDSLTAQLSDSATSEGGNDWNILSHWQLLWRWGIHSLQHIFTGLRQHTGCLMSISHLWKRQKQLYSETCEWERDSPFVYGWHLEVGKCIASVLGPLIYVSVLLFGHVVLFTMFHRGNSDLVLALPHCITYTGQWLSSVNRSNQYTVYKYIFSKALPLYLFPHTP